MTAGARMLTIGMPTYRNQSTVQAAVQSLLAQSFGDFELVISDDNSPDDTFEVCRQLAKLDDRIRIVRQPVNLKYQNFGFLLREAKSPFFMWAAGDDLWRPGYVEACLRALQADAGAVLAVTRVMFTKAGEDCGLSDGTYPLLQGHAQNLARYLSAPGDNSRMYGVFRTEAGKSSFPAESFHAYDWAFSAALLRFGTNVELPDMLLYRDKTSTSDYARLAIADAAGPMDRHFPLARMSRWLHAREALPRDALVYKALAALNIDKHLMCAAYRSNGYSKLAAGLDKLWRRHLRWRMVQA